VMVSHDYMITPLQTCWKGFHRQRTAEKTSRLPSCWRATSRSCSSLSRSRLAMRDGDAPPCQAITGPHAKNPDHVVLLVGQQHEPAGEPAEPAATRRA
jgi:hypothetical protein